MANWNNGLIFNVRAIDIGFTEGKKVTTITQMKMAMNKLKELMGEFAVAAAADIGACEIPSGVITRYKRDEMASCPQGYAICNGENGTPDMSSEFTESFIYIMKI